MNLRKLDWADIIVYFIELKSSKSNKPKDLIDYFHFKYLTEIQLDRWTVPVYRFDTAKANKVLSLYGWDFSLHLIDLLFKEYNTLLRGGISDLSTFRLGLLSGDSFGWLAEKLFVTVGKEKKNEIFKLLSKPREVWTQEETDEYRKLISGGV